MVEVTKAVILPNQRDKRRFQLFLDQMLPINSAKPRMLLDVGYVLQSYFCLLLEKLPKKVFEVIAPVLVKVWFSVLNFIEEFASVFGVKGR